MFRRRKTELEDVKPIMESNDELGLSGKPATRPGAGIGSGKPPVMPTQPPRPTDTVRPGIEMPRQTPANAVRLRCSKIHTSGDLPQDECRHGIEFAESPPQAEGSHVVRRPGTLDPI